MYKEFSKVYDEFMEYADYDMWYETVKVILDHHEVKGDSLLDLGCGTGEILLRAHRDYECTGVDLSEGMLTRAAEKLGEEDISLPLVEQDMTRLNLGRRFDVIISMFDTVNHLTTLEGLDDLFRGIGEHLEDEGIYMFDVVDRTFMEEMFPGGVFLDERENMTVIWEHEFEEGLDYINTTFFVKNDSGSYDKYIEDYAKRIFTKEEIEKAAEDNNLTVSAILENDQLAGRRYFYCLKKK